MGPYEDGFSLPEGLRRHLDGYGNVHRCEVLQAAFELAWDDLRDTLDEADRAERQIAQARRDSEVLYRIGPDELRLSDEFLFGEARGPEALVWAEERLASLGFNPSVDGRVRSYCMQDGDVSIYADPRPAGKIEFRVYRTAAGRKRRAPHYASFHILDGWKNDLMRKYRRGLDEAVARL